MSTRPHAGRHGRQHSTLSSQVLLAVWVDLEQGVRPCFIKNLPASKLMLDSPTQPHRRAVHGPLPAAARPEHLAGSSHTGGRWWQSRWVRCQPAAAAAAAGSTAGAHTRDGDPLGICSNAAAASGSFVSNLRAGGSCRCSRQPLGCRNGTCGSHGGGAGAIRQLPPAAVQRGTLSAEHYGSATDGGQLWCDHHAGHAGAQGWCGWACLYQWVHILSGLDVKLRRCPHSCCGTLSARVSQ